MGHRGINNGRRPAAPTSQVSITATARRVSARVCSALRAAAARSQHRRSAPGSSGIIAQSNSHQQPTGSEHWVNSWGNGIPSQQSGFRLGRHRHQIIVINQVGAARHPSAAATSNNFKFKRHFNRPYQPITRQPASIDIVISRQPAHSQQTTSTPAVTLGPVARKSRKSLPPAISHHPSSPRSSSSPSLIAIIAHRLIVNQTTQPNDVNHRT